MSADSLLQVSLELGDQPGRSWLNLDRPAKDDTGRQLDLFSAAGLPAPDDATAPGATYRLEPNDLCDAALVAVLPVARVLDCHALCAEAGRRRLVAAIPALAALCRRFKGFGLEHAVPEQVA